MAKQKDLILQLRLVSKKKLALTYFAIITQISDQFAAATVSFYCIKFLMILCTCHFAVN